MKKENKIEKKLSLKKLQIIKINNLVTIKGGIASGQSLSINDQTTGPMPTNPTVITGNGANESF